MNEKQASEIYSLIESIRNIISVKNFRKGSFSLDLDSVLGDIQCLLSSDISGLDFMVELGILFESLHVLQNRSYSDKIPGIHTIRDSLYSLVKRMGIFQHPESPKVKISGDVYMGEYSFISQ